MMTLRRAVIVAGIATALLVVMPHLVIAGLFLIVPGIVMVTIPTVFVYLALTLLVRPMLPLPAGRAASAAAFALAVAIGWLVVQPERYLQRAKYDAVMAGDVVPPLPPALAGHVRLQWPPMVKAFEGEFGCNHLCLALLDRPGVESVTVAWANAEVATFRLGGSEPGTIAAPVTPGMLARAFSLLDREANPSAAGVDDAGQERALAAHWALRLALGEPLRRVHTRKAADAEWTVLYRRQTARDDVRLQRIELRDRSGDVRARSSMVEHEIPVAPLLINFEGGSAVDGFSGAHWEIATERLATHRPYHEFLPEAEVVRLASLPRPELKGNELRRLRNELEAALADPNESGQRLALANAWLDSLGYDAPAEDLPLLARILEDTRVEVSSEAFDRALPGRADLTLLRRGLARRFLTSDDGTARSRYVRRLAAMPEGTFAEPTPDEVAIWNDTVSRPEGAQFLERMSDRGPAAVPDLLRVIESVSELPWWQRWRSLEGAARAFQRLGKDGAAAIATIRALLERPRSPLKNGGDSGEWLLTLARLGVVPEDLPYGPSVTPDRKPAEVERIRSQLERYERELAAKRGAAGS